MKFSLSVKKMVFLSSIASFSLSCQRNTSFFADTPKKTKNLQELDADYQAVVKKIEEMNSDDLAKIFEKKGFSNKHDQKSLILSLTAKNDSDYEKEDYEEILRRLEINGLKINKSLGIANALEVSAPEDAKEKLVSLLFLEESPFVEHATLNLLFQFAADLNGIDEIRDSWGVSPDVFGGINVAPLWAKGIFCKKTFQVAVLDSGYMSDHLDLPSPDPLSYDFAEEDNDPYDDPPNGHHGTEVAGVIAAKHGNGIGVRGVCGEISIVALRIFDDLGGAKATSIIQAVNYLYRRNLRLANMSFGLTVAPDNEILAPLQRVFERLSQKDILLVIASGNDGAYGIEGTMAPASFDYPNILSVAAHDQNGVVTDFSSYAPSVGLTGPGSMMPVLAPEHVEGAGGGYLAKTILNHGTSFAAPHVAGVAALLMSAFPQASALEVKEAMVATVDRFTAKTDPKARLRHTGRLNAEKAYGFLALRYPGKKDSPETSNPPVKKKPDPAPVKKMTQNPVNKYDVNNDGKVTSIDALNVINYLNRPENASKTEAPTGPPYLDSNGDGRVTSIDALLVINFLNPR